MGRMYHSHSVQFWNSFFYFLKPHPPRQFILFDSFHSSPGVAGLPFPGGVPLITGLITLTQR